MQVIGLCRFSWPGEGGFQVEHPTLADRIAYLYDPSRLAARLAWFEAIALPGLIGQTDPDFTFLVVIGDSLPDPWRARLEDLLRSFPQAQIVALPPGPHRKTMQAALNAAKIDPAAPCLQFRHDDDDAVAVDFVERLRHAAANCAGLLAKNRLVAFDFNKGYGVHASPEGLSAAEIRLPLYGVALGMAVQGGVERSIMNFAHKKLGQFMPVVSFADSPMFLRGYSDMNDSRQKPGTKPVHLDPLDDGTARILRDRFRVEASAVRQAFAAG